MVSYTPQRQWIEKGGIKLWLAFFFIELGAGMFLVASLFDSLVSMSIGWLFCAVLGGGFHLLYLGKPLRFWRMVFSSGWRTSWISRGLVFVVFFLVLSLVHIILAQSAARSIPLLTGADVFAFLTIIYGGFAMNYVNGIPLWNTALLPILYVVSGLWGGAEVTLAVASMTGTALNLLHEWILILLTGFIFLIPVYLMSVRYTSQTGQVSVRHMVLDKWAGLFWIGVILLGMVVPLSAVIEGFLVGPESTPVVLLYGAVFSGLIGDLSVRYLILRCGMYSPLIPSSS